MEARSQLRPQFIAGGILVFIAMVAGAFWLSSQEGDSPPVDSPGGATDSVERLEEPLVESSQTQLEGPAVELVSMAELLPATVESDARQALGEVHETVYLSGRVVTEGGEPIDGAQVSWTAWDPRFLPYVFASVTIPPWEIEANTVAARTGPQGRFSLNELPPLLPDESSYLWVTHGTHEAFMLKYEPSVTGVDGELVVELKAAEAMVASVVIDDVPVPGALVFQQAAFPMDSNAPMEGGDYAPEGLLVFLRQFKTSDQGRGPLAPAAHRHRVFATHEELSSVPWRGAWAPTVKLDLNPSCTLSGYVGFPMDYDERWGMPHVRVSRRFGPFLEHVAAVVVHSDGTIGPGAVPVLPAEAYILHLDGGGFVPGEQMIPTPSGGQEIHAEFEGEIGGSLWFLGMDKDEEVLHGTELVVEWDGPDGRFKKVVRARADGYIRLAGVPPGVVTGSISAKGYGRERIGPLTVPEEKTAVHAAFLWPSRQLKGLCLEGLDPAKNFEVRYWGVDSYANRGTVRVSNSEDGTFVIGDANWGKVGLEAISEEFGRSQTVTVDMTVPTQADLVLVLRPPLAIVGTVVQPGTGEPISGARVGVHNSQGQYEMDPIGAPVTTGADGKFDISRLGPGRNFISISADGYSTRKLEVVAKDGVSRLGNIALSKSQPLTARLFLPPGDDPSRYVLMVNGIGAIRATNFESSGELRIENANAGTYRFQVKRNDQAWETTLMSQICTLVPGELWHLEFNVAGSERSIRVETTGGDPAGREIEYRVGVTYTDLNGNESFQAVSLNATGGATIRGNVGQGPVSVRITATDGSKAGGTAQTIGVGDPPETVLHVALGSKLVRVRVVDASGKPLPGIEILPRSSASGGMVLGWQFTDAKGEAHFRTLPPETDEVTLAAASGGTIDRVPFQYPAEEGEWVELVFDMSSSMTFFLHDGGVPLSAASCRLFSGEHGYTLTPSRTPDADGRVTFSDLGPGSYDLHVEAPGRWSLVQGVQATPAGSEYSVEVRRVGTLVLEFETSSGGPLAGAPVVLEYTPLSQMVGSWAKVGRLPGHSAQLRTDAAGLLQLEGIPHGEYRWACAGAAGTVVLEPGAVTRTKLTVQ